MGHETTIPKVPLSHHAARNGQQLQFPSEHPLEMPLLFGILPPWMFWMPMLVLAQQGLHGGQTNSSLGTSLFAPESTPAHFILHLADFVLLITGVIFVWYSACWYMRPCASVGGPTDDGKSRPKFMAAMPWKRLGPWFHSWSFSC